MDITWYGLSCFRMVERGRPSIVTDPYDEGYGPAVAKLKAEIVTSSHDAAGHNAAGLVKGVQHVISRPGEYEIGGIFITGIQSYNPKAPSDTRPNTIFTYDYDSVTVCHLGDLDHVPAQSQIESLGSVNVLLVPVGGGRALNSGQASEVISLFEPDIVIPMHYEVPGMPIELEPLERFLKEMGVTSHEEQDSLRVSSASMSDETQIVVLRPQGLNNA